jgi:hypothetical protein
MKDPQQILLKIKKALSALGCRFVNMKKLRKTSAKIVRVKSGWVSGGRDEGGR